MQKPDRCSKPAMPGRFSPFGRVSPSSSSSAVPVLLPLLPLLPASTGRASATPIALSRLLTGFSFYRLHLATFPPLTALAVRFEYGGLTNLTRRASHPLNGEPYPGSSQAWCYQLWSSVVPLLRRALPLCHRSYGLRRQTIHLLTDFSLSPYTDSPCRLLSAPAGRWLFPTLSLHSLLWMNALVPRCLPWCSCLFLPIGHRPSPRRRGRVG